MRVTALCLLAAIASGGWTSAGHAAIAEVAREVLVRDCISRFGSDLAQASADTLSDEAVNFIPPTTQACLMLAALSQVDSQSAQTICGYYFTD